MAEKNSIKFNGKQLVYRSIVSESNKLNMFLLHGFSFTSANWEDIDLYNHFFKMGYNVYGVDYPGFGESEVNSNFEIQRGDIENSQLFLVSFIDFLGISRATIIGASMGGGMALLNNLQQPEKFEKLILISPAWFELEMLPELKTPSLFIFGEKDKVVPMDKIIKKAENNNKIKVEIIKEAGHASYLEKPEEFFKIVDKYIN
jgi:pimeloyl-ACP methyl ester carboxylesterase